jgi:integrase
VRLAAGVGGKLPDEALVFSRATGEPVTPKSLGQSFVAHCEARGFTGVTFHATRHTHITALLTRVGKAGAKAVSQRAGHANLSTTLGIYQTVFEADDRNLADLTAGMFKRGPKTF